MITLNERVMKIETKLDDLIQTVSEMRAEMKCYATQEEVNKVKLDVEKLKNKALLVMGGFAVILWLLNHYSIKLFN
jgi:hypothetical protein